ncbi:SAM-dependent methyltransferase [Plantactinospora siamensis]|uniref:SAM-dependent methyltransferase n=1 Tax=Plantactinospora siamensis TaxID=555372 RepID=A0ABV6NPK8_9ACTN
MAQGTDAPRRDWHDWHRKYDDPRSTMSLRLAVVRERIRLAVDAAPPGPIRVLSLCAGDGRDLTGALADHRRRADVRGLLVELDPGLADAGRSALWPGLDFLVGDAALTDNHLGAVPADLVLLCGIFGNISDGDVAGTVRATPSLLAPGGRVIWTRHRSAPDLVPTIDGWFAAAGFAREFLSGAEHRYGVGVHRLVAEPEPPAGGRRLFTFLR